MSTPKETAQQLIDAYGFKIVPLGKLSKRPYQTDWPNKARNDTQDIKDDENYGIVCEGLTVIDFDPRSMAVSDPSDDNEVDMVIDLIRREYGFGPTLEIVTGSGGVHLFYRGETKTKVDAPGVDVKSGRAHQVVGAGSLHPKTEKPYRVWRKAVIEPVPPTFQTQSTVEGEWDGESSAMAEDGISEGNRNEGLFSHLCLMRRRGLNDQEISMYAIVANQTMVSPPLNDGELARIVQSVKEFEPGQHDLDTLQGLHDSVPHITFDESEEWADLATMMQLPEPAYLIERMLPETGVGQLVGQSYAGKTFVAIALMMALAQSDPGEWFGHKVLRGGIKSAYVAMEGGFDLGQRLKAWQERHGEVDPANLRFLVEKPFDLQSDIKALERLADSGFKWDLLIIDTQSLAAPRLDENDNSHMTALMALTKRLSVVYNCFVILVHHAGHSGDRARGASSQFANMDLSLFVGGATEHRNTRILRMDKLKSGPLAKPIVWDLEDSGTSAVAVFKELQDELADIEAQIEAESMSVFEKFIASARAGRGPTEQALITHAISQQAAGHVVAEVPVISREGKEGPEAIPAESLTDALYNLTHEGVLFATEGGYELAMKPTTSEEEE